MADNINTCKLCGTPFDLEYCNLCKHYFCSRCKMNYPGRVKGFLKEKLFGK